MSHSDKSIALVDLLRVANECARTPRSAEAVKHLNTLFSIRQFELQSMEPEHALQVVVDVCRNLEIDFDVARSELDDRARVLDFIRGVRSEPSVDLALEFARLHVRFDEIAAASKFSKGIVPTGVYSYAEAVKVLGVSESTIRRDVRAGRLQTTKIRGCVRFSGTDLLSYRVARQPKIRVLGDA